jgi:hypothetical protein
MASNSETGHAVNISNFKLLIEKCTGFGSSYNPSNTGLSVASMTGLWTSADTAHGKLTNSLQLSKIPINEREGMFEGLNKLVTKTFNYYESTEATKGALKDAKGLADRIRGFGAVVKKLPDGSVDPKGVSKSHQSFVQKYDAFKQLVDLYGSDANYAPNEADLKITALNGLLTDLKKANDDIGKIISNVEEARFDRDHLLYDKDKGLVDVALKCKKYVKGLYGATAAETKSVMGISFRNLGKK